MVKHDGLTDNDSENHAEQSFNLITFIKVLADCERERQNTKNHWGLTSIS